MWFKRTEKKKMEILLHYAWKHRLLPATPLFTTTGKRVDIVDPGLHNPNAGPDFFNAKIKIGGTMWVGNVELHMRSKDWFHHGHDADPAYDNIILHVAEEVDADVKNSRGETIEQMELRVPERVKANYEELLKEEKYPPCYRIVPSLRLITIHSWLAALEMERLESKTQAIRARAERLEGSWEAALFVTLARNFGFGINGETFERWAYGVPLHQVGHHRDDLFQVEAFFMGQAGLLEEDAVPETHRAEAMREGYFERLRGEYLYLAHKFSLTPMDHKAWNFLRLRPQNFPHIRISQLAALYHSGRATLSSIAESTSIAEMKESLKAGVTPYWETHYSFGAESRKNSKNISSSSLNLLMINTAIPMMFAYGRHLGDEAMAGRALSLLEQLRPENNYITRMWSLAGLEARSSGDSQALVQLKKEYCDKKDCLRCRFGYEYLRGRSEL